MPPIGTVGGGAGVASPVIKQLYATNSTTNQGTDTCAGFFNNVTFTCHLTPLSAQVAGTTVLICFNAQAVGITSSQTLAATDTLGNTYSRPSGSPIFFAGNAKTADCLITFNAIGGGIPTITITITTPVSGGERIGVFYFESMPVGGAGTGAIDGTAQGLNLTTTCGAPGSACVGVPGSSFPFGATNEVCPEVIVDGPTEASVTSPWSTFYANNGDHSAGAVAVVQSGFAAPQFTAASSSAAIVLAVCTK